jgi:hypothetical protein
MTEHRWSKFWWQDYEGDDALRLCSLAAQGLWMRMLCGMHRGQPYGHMAVNGSAPTTRQLSIMLCATEREVSKLVPELEKAGVLSRNESGLIYSRRMVRDKAITDKAIADGRRGGNPVLKGRGNGEGLTPPDKPTLGPTHKQEAEAEAEEEREIEISVSDPRVADAERAAPEAGAEPLWPPPPHPSAITARVEQVAIRLQGRARGQPFLTPRGPERSVDEQMAAVAPKRQAKTVPAEVLEQARAKLRGVG